MLYMVLVTSHYSCSFIYELFVVEEFGKNQPLYLSTEEED